MATEINTGGDISVLAGADLSAKQFFVVKDNGSNAAVLSAAGTDTHLGILQNKPTSGKVGAVRTAGISKAVAGAAITSGALLTSDGAGKVIAASANDIVVGIARSAASGANIILPVLVRLGKA